MSGFIAIPRAAMSKPLVVEASHPVDAVWKWSQLAEVKAPRETKLHHESGQTVLDAYHYGGRGPVVSILPDTPDNRRRAGISAVTKPQRTSNGKAVHFAMAPLGFFRDRAAVDTIPGPVRVAMFGWGHMLPNGHAPFLPDGGGVDVAMGEDARKVRRWISEAVGMGLLEEGSRNACLIVPKGSLSIALDHVDVCPACG